MAILKDMKNSSPGWDCISPKIVMQTYRYFLEPLIHVTNMSILLGVFPDERKIAKVIPLYKGGESKLLVNHRPMSVLPVFSKVFERLMYNPILEFINENGVIYYLQFGFRKNHSTAMALTLMFLVKNMSAPPVLFIENRYVHDYNSRQKDKFHVPNAKRNYLQRTISYKGVVIWNYISMYVTYDCSLASFKFALR